MRELISMENFEKIRDIFSILHDGTIISVIGDKRFLSLKISCQYLAERIDETFEYFFVDLIEIDRLALVPWMNPAELEQEYLVDIPEIFKANLDILSADIENDLIKVTCNQSDPKFDYCGGTLYLNCKDIKIFDQDKNELTVEVLDTIRKAYWDDFSKH